MIIENFNSSVYTACNAQNPFRIYNFAIILITICHPETIIFCCGYILNEVLGDLAAVN